MRPNYGREIEEVCSRVADLEGSVERVRSEMAASLKRLKEMMLEILGTRGVEEGIPKTTNTKGRPVVA